MRVAVYPRVSKDDASQNPEAQMLRVREFCASKRWTIAREYVDTASADDLRGRKAWHDMLHDAERGRFTVLLLWKLDGTSRFTLPRLCRGRA